MIKLLALSDKYIPFDVMKAGLASLAEFNVVVEVRRWEHDTLIDLQQANLRIENGGPDAEPLPNEITDAVEAFDVVIVQFAPVPGSLIEAASSLKLIGVLRGGVENIDVETATGRGVTVMNTPGRNARAVAECTLGMILTEVRNLARAHAKLAAGKWRREFPNSAAIPELNEKTVGLVGYGAVARLVAGYLHAMGSRVIAYDPFVTGDTSPVELVELPELMRQSDVVSIHARLTDETHHLIGAEQLALMKPTAVLVNTARSGLIDETALVDALSHRRIMGAALDVFDVEPLPADHPMLSLDNVTLAPHLAGSTLDAFHNSPKMMAGHIKRMLLGREPLPIVNGVVPRLRSGS